MGSLSRNAYLSRIQFETNSHSVVDTEKAKLDQISEVFKAHELGSHPIAIMGHTDADGGEAANLALSRRRADSVIDELVSRGVSRSQLVSIGLGESAPVAPNDSDRNKEKNRRIEFELYGFSDEPHVINGQIHLKVGTNSQSVVKFVQKQLRVNPVDGVFGSDTLRAVRLLQQSRGLPSDGIVGPVTFAALCKTPLHIWFSRSQQVLKILTPNLAEHRIGLIFSCRAISGLPPDHPKIAKLINDDGRTELALTNDYRLPVFEDVSDAGPIPSGNYKLQLVRDMKFEKEGGAWGIGGWFLDPGRWRKILYKINLSRGEFFLHEDGNGEGTSGCIGVSATKDMKTIKDVLAQTEKSRVAKHVIIQVQ